MKNRIIKVAAAQPQLKVGDVAYNTDKIIKMASELSECGVIVFPELSVTGYTCGDLFLSDLLLEDAEMAMIEIAEKTRNTESLIVIGVPVRLENSLYNCAAIIFDGTVKALIPKSYIPNYSEFYECRWFASGREIKGKTISIGGVCIPFGVDILAEDTESGTVLGVEICEDLWVPDKPSTRAALAGANIIANLSASDELIGKQEYRRQLVAQQSGACYLAYIYASAGVSESSTDLVFSGHSVIAQNGSIMAESIFPGDSHAIAAFIDMGVIMHDRRRQNTYESAFAEEYRRINVRIKVAGENEVSIAEMADIMRKNEINIPRNPFVPADNSLREERCRRILEIQANGLATRVRHTGIKNLVIGVSGGLDSTLALIVCVEAKKIVPDIRIIAYTMPNKGNTSKLTYSNAEKLMDLLADEIHEIPIEDGVNLHLASLGHEQAYMG